MVANRAGRHRVVVVQRQREVRAGETGEQAVLQHRRRAAAALFGRLADHHERALPAVAVFGHQARRARPRRHVNVVPARVHHRRRLSAGVPHDDRAGKRQAGLLFDRERVELGAKHDGRPGAILHDRDDARAADAGRDVEAEGFRARGQFRRGLRFLKRQLWMLMKVDVQRVDVRIDGVDFQRRRRRPGRAARLGLRSGRAERDDDGENAWKTHG